MSDNTITITIDATTRSKINQLKTTRENKTDQELVEQIFQRGLYDLNYRSARNKKQWGMFKEWKASQKSE